MYYIYYDFMNLFKNKITLFDICKEKINDKPTAIFYKLSKI